ncbi:phosphopyruvate hydratase [Candidatus Falkowbacteria bacterium]|uniref:Enolase n=1 Tax=Candidatus Falkowbacteria bacterium CG10_big_fil_rev_8_21_14_0_10_37_18 TaxID=1974562 RepID=A0A2H0V812_9BACT|nr:phosphopyruvate hydratase [Candidatus Falkowbacteria bacterium]NCQ12819.1 phosphopyruvate hydratase [Candidatus Falkowbacteria bacterium]OIO06381.1 MAG: phosphopyruvate hydratase [Candidatus Falkowbacteria bacterium CG1_02_37_21]PIR95213.1 MAG: phosphopyruvate hydratase [Candidatus Falkowbacteria bacterium CG10_big_fil_rev_8_21_14_0_10_37_18]
MVKIKNIVAREILDSRGNPTVEAKVFLDNGLSAVASVPSGASTGVHEACEMRDGDKKRYDGQGVLKAVANVNEIISPALQGHKITDPMGIDKIMIDLDGTANKSRLGANGILAVSLATARAAALSEKKELFVYLKEAYNLGEPKIPNPLFNIFNGGKHADTNLDFQEFLIIPTMAPVAEMVRRGAEVFHELGKVLREAGYDTDTGAEGGYAPNLDSSIEAIELILAAIIRAGYQPEKDFHLGTDVGSSVLYEEATKKYVFPLDHANFTSDNLIGLYHEWLKKYPILYLEDGLAEDAWPEWRELTAELGDKMMIVGDDLFVTNVARLREGIKERAANSIIIKPNQVGTLTETIDCLRLAQKHNYKVIVSHRSGETSDDFIVDLAVATGADYLKAGSLSRGERVAKYNRLMAISELI